MCTTSITLTTTKILTATGDLKEAILSRENLPFDTHVTIQSHHLAHGLTAKICGECCNIRHRSTDTYDENHVWHRMMIDGSTVCRGCEAFYAKLV